MKDLKNFLKGITKYFDEEKEKNIYDIVDLINNF